LHGSEDVEVDYRGFSNKWCKASTGNKYMENQLAVL
jgi:hypothetical protein